MAQGPVSKRQQIEHATSRMVKTASVGVFITIFCLISSYSLWGRLTYQQRVISAQNKAKTQLNSDVSASNQLISAYQSPDFNGATTNLLGQPVTGVQNNNAKIILDSMPSTYDYPALTSTVQALLSNQGVKIDSITGTDQSASQTGSGSSQAVAMPFSFSIDGAYGNIQNIIAQFQKSIRPLQFQTMEFSGNQSDVNLTVTAQTFYEPAVVFKIPTETIK